jgi:hypothetical protein
MSLILLLGVILIVLGLLALVGVLSVGTTAGIVMLVLGVVLVVLSNTRFRL